MVNKSTSEQTVEATRAFARFFTKKAGILNELLLGSNFGLTESRILYELSAATDLTAKELSIQLDLDPGYVSRVLKKFEKQRLIFRQPSKQDRRRQLIYLTKQGQDEFTSLDQKSSNLFTNLLEGLNEQKQTELLNSMNKIQNLLSEPEDVLAPYVIRPHRPGDMGWIIQAHGRIYTREFGWDNSFEAMVAEIAAEFLNNYNPEKECCWIAEKDGMNIGSASVVQDEEDTCKLRLVIVDPSARGLGVGLRLVEECIKFAEQIGYARMTLWTFDNLHAAINIYKKLGFTLVNEAPEHSFGKDLVAQYWQRDLA